VCVEVISVGRELLRGRIPDGNAQKIARYLSEKGALIRRITVVDDNTRAVASALREALERGPHLVVTTGGLGPADDDRTLEGVSDALSRPLRIDASTTAMVEAAYQRLHDNKVVDAEGLTAVREKLCRIPIGATPVENPLGVSPGVICRMPGAADVLSLPGMPGEMLSVLETALPLLKISPLEGQLARREIEAPTGDESAIAPLLDRLVGEFPGIWINSRPAGSRKTGGRILISVEATGESREEAEAAVDGCVKRLVDLVSGNH
jgi:molybdenum cofactor synthesis domain-containing protein